MNEPISSQPSDSPADPLAKALKDVDLLHDAVSQLRNDPVFQDAIAAKVASKLQAKVD